VPAQGVMSAREAGVLESVLGIWREVLDCTGDTLTADSNFFLSGGDSLHLLRVLVRVRERFGVDLPLRDAARFSTPLKMANCCASASRLKPQAQPVAAQQRGDRMRFPCTPGQAALWLAEQCSDTVGLYNTAFLLHLTGALQLPVLATALALLLERHELLRATLHFDLRERRLYATVGAAPVLALEPRAMSPETARQYLLAEAARPFDLAAGPLWRFRLVSTSPDTWSLLVCVHHCVTDGWSSGVLLGHLADGYNALLIDNAWQPLERDREFRRFSLQHESLCQGELRWWRATLEGADRLPGWPHTGSHRWPFVTACEEQMLGEELLAPVHAVRRAASVELSACLLAAVRLALRALTGIDESCIGMPVSLRHTSAQERAVGYYVNFLVLRDRLPPDVPGSAVLRHVQRNLSDALCHRTTPFPELARHLRPALLPSGNPWCDIAFAYQNLAWKAAPFAGMAAAVEPVTLASQYPLKVEFIPAGTACRCRIEYARDVLAPADARNLHAAIRHQLAFLSGSVRNS
jgi:acyl carrier protein